MQLGKPGADLLAEDRRERGGESLDHRHLDAEPAGGCRDLLADESGPDDRETGAGSQLLAQPAGVGEGAQGVDVLVALEEGQPPRGAAGRDQQLLVAQLLAGVEPHGAGARVERLGAGAEQELDPFLLVPPGGPVGDGLLLDRAGQQLLRERRPVVGWVGLGADDPDRPVVAAAAERLRAALGRQAAADDQDSSVAHHASSVAGIARIGRCGELSRARPFFLLDESTR